MLQLLEQVLWFGKNWINKKSFDKLKSGFLLKSAFFVLQIQKIYRDFN